MRKKPVVFVGFNPENGDELIRSFVCQLVRLAKKRLTCDVLVPSFGLKNSLRSLGVRCVRSLRSASPSVCVFITLPLQSVDTGLAKWIDEAEKLEIKRQGFVYKTNERIVPSATFSMFIVRNTEYCNAIHSATDVVKWLEMALES